MAATETKPPQPIASPATQDIQALSTLFDQGRLVEALALAQALTQSYPLHPFAWTVMGAACQQMGRDADALAPMQRAAALMPNDPSAHSNLGIVLKKLGQLDAAQASYQRALQLKPDFAEAHYNLGLTQKMLGQPGQAEASYRRALQFKPSFAEAHNNLGTLLHELGRPGQAEPCFRQALALNPHHLEALRNLAACLRDLGRLEEAEASLRRVLALRTDSPATHSNLGLVLMERGHLDEAEASCRQALALDPHLADAHNTVGLIRMKQSRHAEAQASFRQAIAIRSDYAEAHDNLGAVLRDQGRLDEALSCSRQALVLKPDLAPAHSNLASTLACFSDFDGVVPASDAALRLKPNDETIWAQRLYNFSYHPDLSAQCVYQEFKRWGQRIPIALADFRGHDRNPQRRLKVGYVSPALRQHSSRHFLEPLLARHDRSGVEVYAYAELTRDDAVTARYKSYVDHWVPTRGLSDDALAQRIRDDGIDILVDVAGHTAGNRLLVFARKPAPVSLHWLDFGYTTGLTAIDFYLSDWPSVPQGSEGLFSETPWRLDGPGLVYRPAEGMGEASPLPAAGQGFVTFGSLTRAVRINHHTVRVWAELLKQVPGSRLVINSGDYRTAPMQDDLAKRFATHGIDRERLDIGHHSPPWDVLRQIDIGLDCFPHNSGTTLFESLYLGVPFVTLAGRPSVGRMGSAILHGLGHPEWIADTEARYVEIAVTMASDLPKLAATRASLRAEMQASPLMDEAGFARRVEAAYRGMIENWLAAAQRGQ